MSRAFPLRFSASEISAQYAEETRNRVDSFNKGFRESGSSPELANTIADFLYAYPTMDKELAAIAALEGVQPEDQLAFDLANRVQELIVDKNTQDLVTDVNWGRRTSQLGMLALDSMFQPVSRGFKSAVVAAQETGKSVLKTVGAATLGGLYSAFTPGVSTDNFLNKVIGPGTGQAFNTARAKYGETEFNRALEERKAGRPLNLGSGFLPNSLDITDTQVYLDEIRKGTDSITARKKSEEVYGKPITQQFDAQENRYKYSTKSGQKINISPGRIVAAQMIEPGSTGYNVVSGVVDGVFRLAADPLNLGLMYGAGVKTAMRTLATANRQALKSTDKITTFMKGFVPGKTGRNNRALFYGRTVDDIRKTRWGQKFGQAIAELKGPGGRAFLADIPEFAKLPASIREVLIHVDDADDVWNVLNVVSKGGDLTGKEFDNMFDLLKKYVDDSQKLKLDEIREISINNVNFGLNVIPAKPTVTGEFFNFVAKVITRDVRDVSAMRKFAPLFLSTTSKSYRALPGAKKLLGVGTQIKQALPPHLRRAISLRPETTVTIMNLDEAAKNVDDMLKLSFAEPTTRGLYQEEVLKATSQGQLNEIVQRVNQSIAYSVRRRNPSLEVDIQDLIDQQEAYNIQIEELRQFFSGSAGGSIAFDGTQTKVRYKKLIKDLELWSKKLGIELTDETAIETILEAVPTMHLLSQAADNFSAQLWDPQDIIRATRKHQTLIGPEDSLLRAWTKKPREIITLDWADAFRIPRRALLKNTKDNKLQLKAKGPFSTLADEVQNNVLKPMWMLRLALMLRIAPEEGVRAAFGGKVNFITTPFQRAAMNSNHYLGGLGPRAREDQVFQAYNNLGAIIFTTRMSPDDLIFLKKMIDVKDVENFASIKYDNVEKLIKSSLLEANTEGVVSDYLIGAAVNGFDLRDIRFAELTEKAFTVKTRKIKAQAKGNINGYDGNTYNSMGEAFIESGGFSVDLDAVKYLDLETRSPSEADAFVSAYKEFEFSLGTRGDIDAAAKKAGISTVDYIDAQIDNVFMTDDTVGLLSKQDHVLGTYIDEEGNFILDVAIGLKGDNAVVNAVHMGANAFQESIYIANKELAEKSGYTNLVNDDGLMYLYRTKAGRAAGDIDYDSVLAKEVMEKHFKSNFDALGLTVDEVKGAGKGMPGGGLFSGDSTYQAGMGENAVVQGLVDGRKDLAENAFIMVDKYTPRGEIKGEYWEGLWGELSLLASDPIVVNLVNKGLDDMMVYLRKTTEGKATLKELVRRSHNAEDKLWLTDDKSLRGYLQSLEYRVGKAVGNPTAILRNPVNGFPLNSSQVKDVIYMKGKKVFPQFEVDMSVGAETKLFKIIKQGGTIGSRDWIRYHTHIQTLGGQLRGQGNQKFFKEFIELFKDEVDLADLGPNKIPRKFDLKNRVSETGTVIAGQEIKAAGYIDDYKTQDAWYKTGGTFLEQGYGLLISKPSNYLNRDPLFRNAFYDNAKEVIRFMDEATKRKFIKEAEPWIEGSTLWDDLIKAAKEPSLETTVKSVEQANKVLAAGALNEVLSLFYSTSQRHVASDLFSKYIPFPEIWAEVATTWGKLIVDNPHKFNRTRIAVDNGDEPLPWDNENTFLSKDPNTGKAMFNYVDVFNVLSLGTVPLARKLINDTGLRDALPDAIASPYQTAVFGQDLQDQGVRATAKGFAGGLNLVAQNGFAPGFGPVVTFPARKILDAIGASEATRNFFLGKFAKSGDPIEDNLPAWWKKVFTNEKSAKQDRANAFFATQMDLYTSYVLAGLVDQKDQDSVDKWLQQAQDQAQVLYIFRAAAQFSLPTAIQPRIEVQDKGGTWWATQTLVNKYQEILIRNGYDHYQTQTDFIEKFGINPIPLKQTGAYQVGKSPVKDNAFFFWQDPDKQELLKKYPNTAYYINPDKVEDELYFPAYFDTVSVVLTPEQQKDFMRHSQAIYEYEQAKANIREKNLSPGMMEDERREEKARIEEEYGGMDMFNFQGKPQSVSIPTTYIELRNWEKEPTLKASPEWKYLEQYLDKRDEVLNVLINGGSVSYGVGADKKTLNMRPGEFTSSTNLTGYSTRNTYKVTAREIMKMVWEDLINAGNDTNFPQLANEVLFYELSPNNTKNKEK